MAKAKAQADTASIVEEEKTIETVEQTAEPVETKELKPETDKADKKAEKPIKGNVIIKCDGYAGKSIVLPTRTVQLDEKGCCEVTGEEAERLLTIPGYELSK